MSGSQMNLEGRRKTRRLLYSSGRHCILGSLHVWNESKKPLVTPRLFARITAFILNDPTPCTVQRTRPKPNFFLMPLFNFCMKYWPTFGKVLLCNRHVKTFFQESLKKNVWPSSPWLTRKKIICMWMCCCANLAVVWRKPAVYFSRLWWSFSLTQRFSLLFV